MAVLVVALANDRLVAIGAVDFRLDPAVGELTTWRCTSTCSPSASARALVTALEKRMRAEGRDIARLIVEHDNPRGAGALPAARLPRGRLGGWSSWPVAGGRTYVTTYLVWNVLERDLTRPRPGQ